LLGIFFDPEDGSSMFLQIVSWFSVDFSVFYPRRQNSSCTIKAPCRTKWLSEDQYI
jgi:hypothetical protein